MSAAASPPTAPAAGFDVVRRRLAGLRPGAAAATAPPLERLGAAADAPRTVAAAVVEGMMRAHRVPAPWAPAFAAFLDGTQASRVLDFVNGIAVVHGTVGAVVRARRNRRMTTWAHDVEQRIYAPRRALPDAYWGALEQLGPEVVDTSDEPAAGGGSLAHPFTLRDSAVHRVGRDRERLEQRLAERWCATEQEMLFIDGGISGAGDRVATAACTTGVVKSHRTLYVEGDDLSAVLALAAGERSSVFRIASPKRLPVASWYLRLRDPAGRDPMWGLVRVEAADLPGAAPAAFAERADRISGWVLAEVAPVALPDGRWDKMVYGVRDCEEFLRAIAG